MVIEPVKFETKDRQGRTVRLRESVYDAHLPERPEMADYLEEACRTIQEPDYEIDDLGACCYLRLGLGRGDHEKCFIKVCVYFDADVGEVASFYITNRIGRGKIVWTRPR